MGANALFSSVIWELTYACQLRCTHCYTESGRRAPQKLPRDKLLRIADLLVSLKVQYVALAGGEPLLLPEVFELAARLTAGGVSTDLFTNGILVSEANVGELATVFNEVHVSLDGATAAVHDAIRGRPGSFDAAMRALSLLNRERAARRERGEEGFRFGFDVTLIQSNFGQLYDFASAVAPLFSELSFLALGAAAPEGLANRPSFVERELLTEEQLDVLRATETRQRLRALAPPGVKLGVTDGFFLQMRPDQTKTPVSDLIELEPSGGVRGLVPYEGTVGNILQDAPEMLWERVQERRRDPVVAEALSGTQTMRDWAAAARRLDQHFGAPADLLRIARRPEYVPQELDK